MSIRPTPVKPPCFDPNEPRFWNVDDLEYEMRRAFEICHGCRMCVTYCPSFPSLFNTIDEKHEKHGQPHDATSLDATDMRKVVDLCWQCKICYVKCPYTPDDKHEWQLDFPRVLWREKAVRARREGIPLQEKLLGEPGVLGALNSGPAAPVVNFVSANRLVRRVGRSGGGNRCRLPIAHLRSAAVFPLAQAPQAVGERRHSRRSGTLFDLSGRLQSSVYGQGRGRGARTRGSSRVVRPQQTCCGMPNMDTGDLDAFRDKARLNVEMLAAEVRAGRDIVVPGPSCSMTLRREYPDLLQTEDASLVASHTFDLLEYLWKLQRAGRLPETFPNALGKVAYHAPCHLRAQKISYPARLLLERVPETEVEVVEQCSAVDGTWGMKAEYYDLGVQYSKRLVRKINEAEAKHVASDCPLASQRIMKENGVAVVHPVELLARAYGLEAEHA